MLSLPAPWWLKIALKIVFSRLPLSHALWTRAGLFVLGPMSDPSYAYNVFRLHFDAVDFGRKSGGFVTLEIGPGESVFSALIAKAHKASGTYLVDVGHFANADPTIYGPMLAYLRERGMDLAIDDKRNYQVDEVVKLCNANYLTEGITSLRKIPDASVDFIWSHTVLQHVRRAEFAAFLAQTRRILRPDGACSHKIDFKDCMGGNLNNLRIGSKLWEAEWMAKSGFYTNRLRFAEMQTLFSQAGFEVEPAEVARWSQPPLTQAQTAPEFRSLTKDDLSITGAVFLLRPKSVEHATLTT